MRTKKKGRRGGAEHICVAPQSQPTMLCIHLTCSTKECTQRRCLGWHTDETTRVCGCRGKGVDHCPFGCAQQGRSLGNSKTHAVTSLHHRARPLYCKLHGVTAYYLVSTTSEADNVRKYRVLAGELARLEKHHLMDVCCLCLSQHSNR